MTGAGPAGNTCQGCRARLEAVEGELQQVRERLDRVDIDDVAHTTQRVRELLLTIGELIDGEMTRA